MREILFISTSILLFVFLIGSCGDGESEELRAERWAGYEERWAQERLVKYMEQLEREAGGLDNFDVGRYTQSKDNIVLGVILFSAWAQLAKESELLGLDDEQQAILDQFESEVSQIQRRALPKMRDAYGPIARRSLWEHDITAKTFGDGFRTIEFVGGAFAANRNIKDFQEGVGDLLHQLRFRQSRYKWYDGAGATQYDLNSRDDGELVVWQKTGNAGW